jgi:hypothetical protein
MQTVPVYEWLLADGTPFGCGTKVEFDYWLSEGVNEADSRLGDIMGHEPASEDERRKLAWAA